jgi:hypothetical protein
VDITPANITETKAQTGAGAEDYTASLGMGSVSVRKLLPEALARGLWRNAGAELVALTEAEFAKALEVIGATNNFGLDPETQASEKEREAFWRNLHLEELAMARGSAVRR